MTVLNGKNPLEGFVHDALFYRGLREFLRSVVGTIRAGMFLGEPMLVAVPGQKIGPLRAELGSAAERVRFVDIVEAGRNPSRIIPNVLTAFADANAGHRVRMVGEPIWPDRSSDEYATAVQHEALINIAFRGRSATIVCPYDAEGLGSEAVRDAMRTHPTLVSDNERWESLAYGEPGEVAKASLEPLSEPSSTQRTLVFTCHSDLASVRSLVSEEARRAGMEADKINDLRLAVNEVATNTLAHTDGPGFLRIWRQEAALVCEVRDTGHISDPLVGRRRMPADSDHGHGLMLVNDVCDLVQIKQDPAATTVRLHMRCPPRTGAP